VRITATGLVENQDKLKELAARIRDLSPVLDVAAADTVTLIDDSFDQQRSPTGAPWAPHSPATTAIRAARNRSGRILIDSGRLRQSITTNVAAKSFTFGTNVEYGAIHQLGGNVKVFGRGSLKAVPARPFLPATSVGGKYTLMTTGLAGSHWTKVREMVRDYILKGEL
jgi:phage virion morphogenesis protein